MTQSQTAKVQKLVTADGTYATQSAFDANKPQTSNIKDERVSNSQCGNNRIFLSLGFYVKSICESGVSIKIKIEPLT